MSIASAIQSVEPVLVKVIPPVSTFPFAALLGAVAIICETAIYQEQSSHERKICDCSTSCSPHHLSELFFFKTLQIQSLYILSIFPRAPLSTVFLSIGSWALYRYGVVNKNTSQTRPLKLHPLAEGLAFSLNLVAKIVSSIAMGLFFSSIAISVFVGTSIRHKLKIHSYIRASHLLALTAFFAAFPLALSASNIYNDWKRVSKN